jgi:hypothetical protein
MDKPSLRAYLSTIAVWLVIGAILTVFVTSPLLF